jgi:hypothetical protein
MEAEVVLKLLSKDSSPIMVPACCNTTPRDILNVYGPKKGSAVLTCDNRLLSLDLTLKYQEVTDGSEIVIHCRPVTRMRDEVVRFLSTYEREINAVRLEVHRIHDRVYSAIDRHKRARALFDKLCEYGETEENYPVEPTVIPEKAEAASCDPLPRLEGFGNGDVNQEVMEEGFPFFESFEEAGRYFTKYPWSGWTW